MRPMKISTLMMLYLALALLLTACAAAPTAAMPTLVIGPQASPTERASATPFPTQTPPPTLTPIPPTPSEVPPPTATTMPTTDPALAEVKLIALSWYNDYDLLLGFQFPTSIEFDPANYRVTLEDKEYKCDKAPQFTHRLYCKGQGAKVLATATIRLYQVGSDIPVFEKEVWVPFFPSN